MQEFQVTCVLRENGRVTGLGGRGAGGKAWHLSEAEAIRRIKQKPQQEAFYTLENGVKAYIGVYRDNGVENLRTYRDEKWNNNLGALGTCPVG